MGFITVPVFTRLLTLEDYGIVSVYSSFVTIMAILTGLNLHSGIGRAAIDFAEDYPKYLSSVLSLSFAFFLLSIVSMSTFSNSLSIRMGISGSLLSLATIAGYGSFVFTFYNSHLQFQQKYKHRSLLHMIKAFSEVILAIAMILLISEAKYYGKVFSSVITSTVFAAFIFVIILTKGKRIIYKKAWSYAIKYGIPLIPHSLSSVILAQFDRMAIQSLVGASETGLYSFAYSIGMIPLVFLSAGNSAWAPWLYRQLNQGRNMRVREASKLYSSAFLLVTVAIMMIAPELARILAPSEFLTGVKLIPVILLSYFFNFLYVLYVHFALYRRKTLMISLGSLIAGVLNIILNVKMIPIFGYEIAAWTTVVSYFLLFLFHWFNVRYLLNERVVPLRTMLPLALVASSVTCVLYFACDQFVPFSFYERLIRFVVTFPVIGLAMSHVIRTFKNSVDTNFNDS